VFVAAVIVERFDNTAHAHLETVPPRRGEWDSFLALKQEQERHYGSQVSLYYRDIGAQRAVPVGWVFQQSEDARVVETWVSVVDAATLHYIDIRHLAALVPVDPPPPSPLTPAGPRAWG
jgi:hypothetical protein